jgi:hypothetical protein
MCFDLKPELRSVLRRFFLRIGPVFNITPGSRSGGGPWCHGTGRTYIRPSIITSWDMQQTAIQESHALCMDSHWIHDLVMCTGKGEPDLIALKHCLQTAFWLSLFTTVYKFCSREVLYSDNQNLFLLSFKWKVLQVLQDLSPNSNLPYSVIYYIFLECNDPLISGIWRHENSSVFKLLFWIVIKIFCYINCR